MLILLPTSLISEVEQYYNDHERTSFYHIRSLLYQAIVRYRMGISDSTVMTPFETYARKIIFIISRTNHRKRAL